MENTNDMNVNNIIAEVNAEGFYETTKEKKNIVKTNNINKVNKVKEEKKQCKMDKETKISIAKNAGLVIASGVCEYFKLASPVLYVSVGLVSLCVLCFKLGEYKGKQEVKNA